MKSNRLRLFIVCAFFLISLHGLTAQNVEAEGTIDVPAWNGNRIATHKVGMIVLGSWALANFGVSGFLMTRTVDRPYFFHQMNVFWNIVNVGIATIGLISAYRAAALFSPQEVLKEYNSFTRTLLINAGLDVLYITGGIILRAKGGDAKQQGTRLEGYGSSLILQGSFLLIFDITLAIINNSFKVHPPLL